MLTNTCTSKKLKNVAINTISRKFQIFIAFVAAVPFEQVDGFREKRDIVDSMKNAWGEMVKTLSDAGDAVVHVFKPTEKSVVDKMADSIKNLAQ